MLTKSFLRIELEGGAGPIGNSGLSFLRFRPAQTSTRPDFKGEGEL